MEMVLQFELQVCRANMREHLKTSDSTIVKSLHISHLFSQVSAWEYTEETKKQLIDSLEEALVDAKLTRRAQIVDSLAGEMFFVVYPSQMISLCLCWKNFELIDLAEIRREEYTKNEKIKKESVDG